MTYFLATAKESKQRKPSLLKFLTAKNDFFLGANRVVVTNVIFLPGVNALI
jgi:hypothetical protein